MENKVYFLWGKEGKKYDANVSLFNYIYDKLNKSKEIEWDGYYIIKDLEKSDELEKILKEILPENEISFDPVVRFYHSLGRGSFDYVRIIEKSKIKIVDAVIFPREEEIPDVFNKLKNVAEIITYGGGTSVTGGINPSKKKKYSISLDTKNLNVFNLDEESMVLEVGAGITGPELEKRLNEKNLTMGNFPESFEYSTVGGWIATNAAGQESNRYGKIKDMVIGIKLITPSGIFVDHKTPAESAFFKVSDIGIGSEGAFGIISRAWVKVHRMPEKIYYKSYMFKSFDEGIDALRDEFFNERIPIVARLSDEQETLLSILSIKDNFLTKLFKFYLKERHVLENGSILILVNDKKIDLKSGISLGSSPSKLWRNTRYDRPYLYNELLKYGIIAETIETSASWKDVKNLHKNVIDAFNEEVNKNSINGIIMCHASHEYLTGTALYFTFLFYSKNNKEENLLKLRETVINTILENNGSISHHHGIGTYLSDKFISYKGSEYDLIKIMKNKLDPENMLNPEIIK